MYHRPKRCFPAWIERLLNTPELIMVFFDTL
jgi:hypothetical protein